MVVADAGEDEVRLQSVFGYAGSRVGHAMFSKYLFKVVFQSRPCERLPAMLGAAPT